MTEGLGELEKQKSVSLAREDGIVDRAIRLFDFLKRVQQARGARFEMEFPLQVDSSDYVAAVTDATRERQILC